MSIANNLFRSAVRRSFNHSSLKLNTVCRNNSRYVKRNVKLDYASFSAISTNFDLAPIIVSHGLFGNKKEWADACKELNALTGRKVIAYDAVNHGASSHHDSMSYHDMALDLVTLLEKLNINKKVTCVGHRMGGKTAMTLALAQPERIAQLVVIDITPCAKASIMGDITLALQGLLNVKLDLFQTKEEVVEKIADLNMVPLLHNSIVGNIGESPKGGLMWNINLNALIKNYSELVSFPSFNEEVFFTGPSLFLTGNGSRLMCEHDHPSIMKRFPCAELHYLEKSDYNIHKSKPVDMLNVLSEFLHKQVKVI